MSFYIGNPLAFILLIFLPFIIWLSRGSLAGLSSFRHRMALGLRLIVTLILILALAEIQYIVKSKSLTVLFVLDVSRSIPPGAQDKGIEFLKSSLEQMKPEIDQASLLVFGKDASFEFLNEKEKFPFYQIQSEVDDNQTNMENALKLAIAGLPETGQRRIVFIGDGNETEGKALFVAKEAKANDISIDIVPITASHEQEVLIEKMISPAELAQGQPYEVFLVIRSQKDTKGTLKLYLNNQEIRVQKEDLKKGKNSLSIKIPGELVKSGFQKLRAIIESPDDVIFHNNFSESFSYVRGTPHVLYIEGDPDHSDALFSALTSGQGEGEKIKVTLGGVADIPNDIAVLNSYDSIIVSNVSRQFIQEGQMRFIESAVREGGLGFIMIGGENSFGAGGYRNTPIEKALPVEMDIQHKKVIPNGALAIVLHTCEFNDGNVWGRRIAKKAIDVLSPSDYAGVLLYDWQKSTASWLFNMTPVIKKTQMFAKINACSPGDMPSFAPTLQAAYNGLIKTPAGRRHIVIITDGDPSRPAQGLMGQIQQSKISISTIVIKPHPGQDTKFMQAMAQMTGGNYYFVRNPNQLPSIFVKEALIAKRSLIFEKEVKPTLAYHTEPISGISSGEIPILRGYVLTTAKPLARVPLHIDIDEEQKDPLLAHMQYGLGRTVAFTSDAKNRWASNWMGWSKFNKFWLQLTRWSLRKTQKNNFNISTSLSGSKGEIAIDALDKEGKYLNFLQMQGAIILPSGHSQEFPISQLGPGRYQGDFPASEIGTYLIRVAYKDGEEVKHFTTGLSVSFSPEYLSTKPNFPLLKQIGSLSGGRMIYSFMDKNKDKEITLSEWGGKEDEFSELDQDDNQVLDEKEYNGTIFEHDKKPRGGQPKEMWPLLVVLFLLLFPVDVFIRRVLIDYRKLWQKVRGSIFSKGGSGASTETMSRLSQVKEATRKNLGQKDSSLDLKSLEKAGRKSSSVIPQVSNTSSGQKEEEKEKSVSTSSQGKPEKKSEEGETNYTSRLLAAKRKTWEDKDKKDKK